VAYAQAQQVEAQRESIREENKKRRKEGLPRIAVPRKTRLDKKVVRRVTDTSATDESSEPSTDDDEFSARKAKVKDKFTYEGRESMPSVSHQELTRCQR
jgi:hypothetical protein